MNKLLNKIIELAFKGSDTILSFLLSFCSKKFQKWFRNWKPIHLCWWFRKQGLTIPRFLIGNVKSWNGVAIANIKSINGVAIADVKSVLGLGLASCGDTFKDYDGNTYHTVSIGSQCWMVENLDTQHYKDGTAIPTIEDNTDWSNDTTGARAYYNNAASDATYGSLYNWHAVDNAHGLAPEGWHIPTDDEWAALEIQICQDIGNGNCPACTTIFDGTDGYRGQDTIDAHGEGSAMAGGCSNWADNDLDNDGDCDNDFGTSGLDVLPAGYRNTDGSFYTRGTRTILWSSLESGTSAWMRFLDYGHTGVSRYTYAQAAGFAVRCLRD